MNNFRKYLHPPCNGKTFLPSGESSGAIRTQTLYDANSRVIALIDDHGATTTYTYDTLDRQITMSFADGATRYSFYDAASDLLVYVNENNSTFTHTYDATGRRTATAIDKSTGVEGTDSQAFEYDGLSRRTSSNDHVDAGGGVDADCVSVYDSISRVLEDSQTYDGNTRNATNTAFTSLPVTGFTFPGGSGGGGGRQVTHTYDALYRRTQLEEGYGPPTGSIAAWTFFGPSRVAEVTLGNGLIQTMMNNTRTHSAVQAGTPGVPNPSWGTAASDRLGYDGAGRMIAKRFLAGGVNEFTGAYNDTTPVVGFTTAFDPASNKYFERALHAESRSSLYQPSPASDGTYSEGSGIDSVNRLRLYERGTLASSGGSGGGGGSVVTPITLPGTDSSRGYDLDHLGNWKNTPFRPVGGSNTLELRQHNKLNQITSRKVGSASTVPFSYDKNGNLLNDGVRIYTYDAFNRLLQVNRVSDSEVIGTYAYDASLARRVRKVISNGGLSGDIPDDTTDYLYLPGTWQCCEERNASSPDDPTKQYAWGLYIDELVEQKTYIDTGSQPLAAGNYYPLQDLLYRTTALTNSDGGIVEAYDTDAYGNTLIFKAAGTGGSWWADDAAQTDYPACSFIYQGLLLDAESGLLYNRYRMAQLILGRFLQRDPIFYFDDMNPYLHLRLNPTNKSDPYGLCNDGDCRMHVFPPDSIELTLGITTAKGHLDNIFSATLNFQNVQQFLKDIVDSATAASATSNGNLSSQNIKGVAKMIIKITGAGGETEVQDITAGADVHGKYFVQKCCNGQWLSLGQAPADYSVHVSGPEASFGTSYSLVDPNDLSQLVKKANQEFNQLKQALPQKIRDEIAKIEGCKNIVP